MDDFINQATSVITTWQQLGAFAGLVVLVNLLTNLSKLPSIARRVPVALRPWIALALGSAGGAFSALATGKPLVQALMSGVVVGMGAISTHELFATAAPKQRAKRKAMRAAATTAAKEESKFDPSKVNVSLLLIVVMAFGLTACHNKCDDPAYADSLTCAAKKDVVDCTTAEAKDLVVAFLPLALSYVTQLTKPDGQVDWAAFVDVLKDAGIRNGGCIFTAVVQKIVNIPRPTSTPQVDPDLQREMALKERQMAWPHLRYKTEMGEL